MRNSVADFLIQHYQDQLYLHQWLSNNDITISEIKEMYFYLTKKKHLTSAEEQNLNEFYKSFRLYCNHQYSDFHNAAFIMIKIYNDPIFEKANDKLAALIAMYSLDLHGYNFQLEGKKELFNQYLRVNNPDEFEISVNALSEIFQKYSHKRHYTGDLELDTNSELDKTTKKNAVYVNKRNLPNQDKDMDEDIDR